MKTIKAPEITEDHLRFIRTAHLFAMTPENARLRAEILAALSVGEAKP